MSNQKEHNSVIWKKLVKLLAGLAIIALVYLAVVLYWQYRLPGLRIHPLLRPMTNTVVMWSGIPALLTYLIWYVVLWASGFSSNTAYKSILWTCVVLVVTALLQLVLSMIFGVMAAMATTIAIATIAITAAAAVGFFFLRP